MARKSKGPKRGKNSSRRRRVSGTGKGSDQLINVALGIGGAVVANMLGNKFLPDMDGKIKGGLLVGAGVFLIPMISNDPMAKAVGLGVAIGGGQMLLKEMGVLSGASYRTIDVPMRRLPAPGSGVDDFVAGTGVPSYVAGKGKARRYMMM